MIVARWFRPRPSGGGRRGVGGMGGAGGGSGPLVAGGLCDPTRLPVDDVHLRAGKTFIKPFFDLFWVNKGFLIKFAPQKPLFSRFAPLKPLFFKFASPKPL